MNDKVKYLPGVTKEENEEVTVEMIVKDLIEKKAKEVVVVSILEDGSIMITGNATLATGVFLLEKGKSIILENI